MPVQHEVARALVRRCVAVVVASVMAVGSAAPRAVAAERATARPSGTLWNVVQESDPAAVTLAEPPSGNWLARAQELIAESEYEVTWQTRTPLSDLESAYQAPNRAQGIRTYFTENGIRVVPRTEALEWEWSLSLAGFGRADAMRPVSKAGPRVTQARVDYARDGIEEWYRNEPRGLEQGFTVLSRPEERADDESARVAKPAEVGIEMDLEGTLSAYPTEDGQAIEFRTPHGDRALTYEDLIVTDAMGTRLTSRMEAFVREGRRGVRLLYEDDDAVYPVSVDPLATTPARTIEIGQVAAQLGVSVATAGDVNGDGYSDVIVGAYFYDNGETNEGRAYLFLGSSSGMLGSVAWTAEGNQTSSRFGFSVATAGDVNGDGYADVIVGAYGYDNGQTDEGAAFVYLGSASGLSPTAVWTGESNQTSSQYGVWVATAGDVNGDGYSDILVGAQLFDNGQTDEGRAYLYLGSASGPALNPGWTTEGNLIDAELGVSVATAGDVNGDGYADVIVGALRYGTINLNEGAALVFHGSAAGLSPTAARILSTGEDNGLFGDSVSTAGDVNGDGYADVIVGVYHHTNGQTEEGQAIVYRGSSSGIVSTPLWSVETNDPTARFGACVAAAGDVNGDGYADVIVGAFTYDSAVASDVGRAYVYLGSPTGPGTVSSWITEGAQAGEQFGTSVATAGDVNGDGYADVLVGAPLYTNGQTNEGQMSVYMGSASGLSTSAGWTSDGPQAGELLGVSVATAGDVNGDGYSDVIIGASGFDTSNVDAGRALVFLGSSSGLETTPVWTKDGSAASNFLGGAVAAAGDINGDGYGDVIVGAGDFGGQHGAVWVYLGSTTGPAATAVQSIFSLGRFGASVAAAGDVNGDGFAEFLVGAPEKDDPETDEGAMFLYPGSPTGSPQSAPLTIESDTVGAHMGASVAAAGDVDRDGYSDVIVGIPDYGSETGRVQIYRGTPYGLSTTPAWVLDGGQTGEEFGTSVASAGDVNGDGYSDVVIGAPSFDNGQTSEGRALVYLGSAAGPGAFPVWTAESNQAVSFFGTSVASAGDVNGDGYSDIVVGSPYFDNGQTDEGRAYLYLGSATGPAVAASWIVESNAASGHLGQQVAAAGDVNGDGYGDVIVGAPGYNSSSGRAILYYGNGGLGDPRLPMQQRSTTAGLISPLGVSDDPGQLELALRGRTPFGRGRVRLEWELKPLTSLLNAATGTLAPADADTGVTGVSLTGLATPTASSLGHHWRARLRYSPVTTPFAPRSRWYSIAWNGPQEVDLRIRGIAGVVSPTLMIEKLSFLYRFSWGGSCNPGDFDYSIYEGRLGQYYSHTSLICSTGGALSKDVNLMAPRSVGDHYYLVVPVSSGVEGSYGTRSDGTERPPGTRVCRPQEFETCP